MQALAFFDYWLCQSLLPVYYNTRHLTGHLAKGPANYLTNVILQNFLRNAFFDAGVSQFGNFPFSSSWMAFLLTELKAGRIIF